MFYLPLFFQGWIGLIFKFCNVYLHVVLHWFCPGTHPALPCACLVVRMLLHLILAFVLILFFSSQTYKALRLSLMAIMHSLFFCVPRNPFTLSLYSTDPALHTGILAPQFLITPLMSPSQPFRSSWLSAGFLLTTS